MPEFLFLAEAAGEEFGTAALFSEATGVGAGLSALDLLGGNTVGGLGGLLGGGVGAATSGLGTLASISPEVNAALEAASASTQIPSFYGGANAFAPTGGMGPNVFPDITPDLSGLQNVQLPPSAPPVPTVEATVPQVSAPTAAPVVPATPTVATPPMPTTYSNLMSPGAGTTGYNQSMPYLSNQAGSDMMNKGIANLAEANPVTYDMSQVTAVPGGAGIPSAMSGQTVFNPPEPSSLEKMFGKYGKAASDWWDKKSDEEKLMYGAGAGLGLMALNTKRKPLPGVQPYTGPLSKFKYDPAQYSPLVATPPTPYQPQYTDYRRYAGGGTIEAMSNANSVGANTGYPMADINHGAYATPYQQPISRNVISDASDTGVNPITGEMSFAAGGISDLGAYSDGGRMLKGPGDGMSDNIPASIAGKQPARLANEEFVVPADVVSHLGNGSSDAGAKQLYKMMDRVRQARTGKKAQGKQINPSKYMPA